jgi:uncharacterized protein YecT (DUF1311 family)
MNRQAGKELLKADNELNAVYARLLRASDHASALKLKAAEKAWIAYRDSEAAYESTSNEGGSIYPLVLDKILTDMTEQRTELLKDILRRGNEYLIR